MKKRVVLFTIFSVIFGLVGIFFSFVMVAEGASGKLLGGTFLEPIHTWFYSDGVQNFMNHLDLGPVFYIAVAAVIIISLLALIFLRVKPVNDQTMPPINVKQTAYAIDYSKDAIVPSMVVVNEEVEKDGEDDENKK